MSATNGVPILPRTTLVQLYTRFLLNLPEKLKNECNQNFVRLFFELERAHWFYLDHYIEDPSIGGVDMFGFAAQLFQEFPEIVPPGIVWQDKYFEWRKYRGETETGSAIILDEYFEMILLVQGFYGNRWSFPGGKVNENESLTDCAGREVLEETGLDVTHRISPYLFIDRMVGGTRRRAFIVENVPRISRLQPGTRNEIEAITWFNVHDLPTYALDPQPIEKLGMKPNSFYLVMPFMKQLREYIRLRRTGLPALSALEESVRIVELNHLSEDGIRRSQSRMDKHPNWTPQTPFIPRHEFQPSPQNQTSLQRLLVSKFAQPERLHKERKLVPSQSEVNLAEFRKDLILLNVPLVESRSSTKLDSFSALCWSNVRLRADALLDLLSCS